VRGQMHCEGYQIEKLLTDLRSVQKWRRGIAEQIRQAKEFAPIESQRRLRFDQSNPLTFNCVTL